MSDIIHLPDGRIDLKRRRVHRGDVTHPLTANEAKLLAYLAARAGQTVGRTALLVEVWGYHPDAKTRAIDAAVRRIRTKIEPVPATPTILLTAHGEGYCLAPMRPLEPLIGRGAHLEALARVPPGVHTLVGPGGVGKTTLARRWPAGYFIDLSAVDDLAGVLQATSVALDVPLDGRTEAAGLAQLGFVWQARAPARVVLDNAEQVRAAVARCLTAWADAGITWLITSREALGCLGEHVIGVEPLRPEDAARLFAERISRADAAADVTAVAELMRRLDHLPLAIELAAARAPVLDAAQMVDRLDRSTGLLQGDASARPERQRSMTAALDWSWRLLSPVSQAGLRACAVFRGGFDLAAAEAVLGADALEVLGELMAKHLVVRRGGRFDLLETVRRFAARQTHADLDNVRRAHAQHFVERAEQSPAVIAKDFANLRVAHRGPTPWSIRAALVVLPWLHRRGPRSLRTQILMDAADAAVALGEDWACLRTLYARADAHREAGRIAAARADAQQALAAAERLQDGPWIARVLARMGDIARYAKDSRIAHSHFAAAEAQLQRTPDLAVKAIVLRGHATLLFEQNQFQAAEAKDVQAIAALRRIGDVATEAILLGNLGNVYLDAGREAEAQPLYLRALTLHRKLGDRRFEAIVGANQALTLHLIGALAEARTQAQAVCTVHRQVGNRRFVGFCHYLLAGLCHEAGALVDALDHLTQTLQIWQDIDERVFIGFAQCRLAILEAERGAVALAQQALRDAAVHLADRRGTGWAIHAAIVAHLIDEPGPSPRDVAQATTFERVGLRIFDAIERRVSQRDA